MPAHTPSRIWGAPKVGIIPGERPENDGWQFVPRARHRGVARPIVWHRLKRESFRREEYPRLTR